MGAFENPATEEFYSKPARRFGPGRRLYCAPWCGASCTWAAYQKAKSDAVKLAKRLGKGWTIRVHENMGWHYNVASPCGRIKVSKSGRGSFHAYLSDGNYVTCSGRWSAHGKTPKKAVRKAVAVAVAEAEEINEMTKGLERWR